MPMLPFTTVLDPEVDAEGSIDPLGLVAIADQLAETMIPGVTQRMSRPRFATLCCLSARVCEGLPPRGKDGTPAYVAFEWLVVQAFAALPEQSGLLRVQGMQKARAARRDGVPMSARRYLVSPAVFGIQAAYKRLGRHLGLIDDDMQLTLAGDELLRVWQRERGLDGLASGSGEAGSNMAQGVRRAVAAALESGRAACPSGKLLAFLQESLRPGAAGPEERNFLWRALVDERGRTRGEVLGLLEPPAVRERLEKLGEPRLLRGLLEQATPELRRCIEAIDAYEALAWLLQRTFNQIRFLSSKSGIVGLARNDFAAAAPGGAAKLPAAILRALERCDGSPARGEVERLARDFDEGHDDAAFFDNLLRRHEKVQKNKPPSGKRSWFDHTSTGKIVVRGMYQLSEAPPDEDRYVSQYRLSSLSSFIRDLREQA
jgi:hypothetical protein